MNTLLTTPSRPRAERVGGDPWRPDRSRSVPRIVELGVELQAGCRPTRTRARVGAGARPSLRPYRRERRSSRSRFLRNRRRQREFRSRESCNCRPNAGPPRLERGQRASWAAFPLRNSRPARPESRSPRSPAVLAPPHPEPSIIRTPRQGRMDILCLLWISIKQNLISLSLATPAASGRGARGRPRREEICACCSP
jgi:hypothetical protein